VTQEHEEKKQGKSQDGKTEQLGLLLLLRFTRIWWGTTGGRVVSSCSSKKRRIVR